MRFLFLAFSLPALFVLLCPGDPETVQLYASRIERVLSLLLFALALVYFFRSGSLPSLDKPPGLLWIFLPALTLLVHGLMYLLSARSALFLADQDITNISSAIANTAAGRGVLPSAYVQTGAAGSFLGHHFAPALFLYVPFYVVVRGAGHILYPALLLISLCGGAVLWTLALRRKAEHPVLWLAFLPLLVCVPLFRLSQSFHFEVLALLFSGMAMLALYRGNNRIFLAGILLWSLVKEDTGVYAALLCAYLWWTGRQNTAAAGLVIAVVCVLAGRILQTTLGGGEGPDWTTYLRQGWPALSSRSFLSVRADALFLVFASCGLIFLFRPRYALFVLAPVAALHAFSFHPWHATFYGHYSYSILPLLFAGAANAADRIDSLKWKTPILFLSCAIALYANASDKQTPAAPLMRDEGFDHAQSAVASLARFPDACVHAQSHLSPLVPANRVVLPLFVPEGNPHKNGHGLDNCRARVYLFDERPARGAVENTETIRALRMKIQTETGSHESFGSIFVLADAKAAL